MEALKCPPSITVNLSPSAGVVIIDDPAPQTTSSSPWMPPPESLADYYQYLGRNVTRLRRDASLTKTDLAGLVPMNRLLLARIENGEADPKLSSLHGLSQALGTTIDELLSAPPKVHESYRRSRFGPYRE